MIEKKELSPAPGTRVDHLVLHSSALPLRDLGPGPEICLITSLRKKQWIFPKSRVGSLDQVATAAQAAAEEAGLMGEILEDPLGSYKRLKDGKVQLTTVFLMEVSRCEDSWLESHLRNRRWVAAQQASSLIVKPELQDMLGRALRRWETAATRPE